MESPAGEGEAFQLFKELPEDAKDRRKSNLVWDELGVAVTDFRDTFQSCHLHSHGFISRYLPGFPDLGAEKEIPENYLPVVKKLLENELEGVGTVFIFDERELYPATYSIQQALITLEAPSQGPPPTSEKIGFSDKTHLFFPVTMRARTPIPFPLSGGS
ncbi:uncharacterized protein BDR25DRAFT_311418 [Lindgomyces ingoldianus]|uniref:Uncharacterized protein n=1 Tax=Lindgomyces ingoldianus TaxID=673940 RepID=A0ACB6R7I4_9PLEO|nr:uncharacterized protein BDR25DRAFT_311418 [Lindgomyces ingoldianus]KAF2475052.1 hypothetical protein BDR25DRAFT_311418 [Lindgomyces ingoldianus]